MPKTPVMKQDSASASGPMGSGSHPNVLKRNQVRIDFGFGAGFTLRGTGRHSPLTLHHPLSRLVTNVAGVNWYVVLTSCMTFFLYFLIDISLQKWYSDQIVVS
jgi:hypothetical protein